MSAPEEADVTAIDAKVRAASKEVSNGRAASICDTTGTFWSTGTNAKEWVVLELEAACLLVQVAFRCSLSRSQYCTIHCSHAHSS